MRRKDHKHAAFIVLLSISLAACGLPGSSQVVPDSPAQGKTEFGSFCANCHGVDGSGGDSAPSIFGNDADEIRAQVRSPIGNMPSFSPMLLSESDLDLVVEYVLGLDASRMQANSQLMPREEEKAHLLAALEAINTYQSEVAINHLQQVIALASADSAAAYAEMIASIEYGNTEAVLRELERLTSATE